MPRARTGWRGRRLAEPRPRAAAVRVQRRSMRGWVECGGQPASASSGGVCRAQVSCRRAAPMTWAVVGWSSRWVSRALHVVVRRTAVVPDCRAAPRCCGAVDPAGARQRVHRRGRARARATSRASSGQVVRTRPVGSVHVASAVRCQAHASIRRTASPGGGAGTGRGGSPRGCARSARVGRGRGRRTGRRPRTRGTGSDRPGSGPEPRARCRGGTRRSRGRRRGRRAPR